MNEARLASFMKQIPQDILDEYSAATAGAAGKAAAASAAGNTSAARTNRGRNRRPWGTVLAVIATVAVFFVAGVLISMKIRADKKKSASPATDSTVIADATPTALPSEIETELPTEPGATPDIAAPTAAPYSTDTAAPYSTDTAAPSDTATPAATPTTLPSESETALPTEPGATPDIAAPTAVPYFTDTAAPSDTATPAATPTPTPGIQNSAFYLIYREPVNSLIRFGYSGDYLPEVGGYVEADGFPLDFDDLMLNAPLVDDIDPASSEKLTLVIVEPDTVITDVNVYSLNGEFIVRLDKDEAEQYLPLGRVPDSELTLPGNCFVVFEAYKTCQYYPELDKYERYGYHFVYRFRYTGAVVPTPTAVPTEEPTIIPTEPVVTPKPTRDPNAPAATPKWDTLMTADLGAATVKVPYFLISDAKYIPELGGILYADAAPLDYRALSESVPLLYFTDKRIRITMRQPCIWQRVDMLDMDGNLLMIISDESQNTYPNRVIDFSSAAECGTPLDALVRVMTTLRGDYIEELGEYEYSVYYSIFRVKRAGPEQGYPETPISDIITLKPREAIEPGQTLHLYYAPTPLNYNTGTVRWKVVEGGEYVTVDPVTGIVTGIKEGTALVTAYVLEYDVELTPAEIVVKSKQAAP